MNIRVGPWLADDKEKAGLVEVCHYFLHGGQIAFLGDCTHAFASQTVPLPELPERYRSPPESGNEPGEPEESQFRLLARR